MSNKTVMMKLYDMLDEGQISEIAEIKEYFLMLEKEQIMEGYIMALLDGDAKIRRDAEDYYNETYK